MVKIMKLASFAELQVVERYRKSLDFLAAFDTILAEVS